MKRMKMILVAIILSVSLFNVSCSNEPDIKVDKTLNEPVIYAQLGHIPDQIKYWKSTKDDGMILKEESQDPHTLIYNSKKFPDQTLSYVFEDGKCVLISMGDLWTSNKMSQYMIEGTMETIKEMGFNTILERDGDGDTEIIMTYGHDWVNNLQCKLNLDMRRLPKTAMLLTYYRIDEEN